VNTFLTLFLALFVKNVARCLAVCSICITEKLSKLLCREVHSCPS
jgi:hypothetical protein